MAFRIAAASSDGEQIDEHFGRASTFYVYDITAEAITFIEKRSRFASSDTEPDRFAEITETLKGCHGVAVSQIGPAAIQYLAARGFRVFEAPYPIRPVLAKLQEALRESRL